MKVASAYIACSCSPLLAYLSAMLNESFGEVQVHRLKLRLKFIVTGRGPGVTEFRGVVG